MITKEHMQVIKHIKLLIYNESDKKKFKILNNMELQEKLYENTI